MKKALRTVDRGIGLLEEVAGALALGVIAIVVPVQAFFRYVLKSGILWANELATLLLVFTVMMGAAIAFRVGSHTDLQGFVDKSPKLVRLVVRVCTNTLTLAFLIVFTVTSLQYAMQNTVATTTVLKIPMCVCYATLPLGGILMIYEFLKVYKHRITAEPEEETAVDVP